MGYLGYVVMLIVECWVDLVGASVAGEGVEIIKWYVVYWVYIWLFKCYIIRSFNNFL